MKKLLLFLLPLLAIFIAFSAKAQTKYIAVKSGYWTSSSTWSPRGVPGANDTAVIGNGYTVTLKPQIVDLWLISWVTKDSFNVAKLIIQDTSELDLKHVYTTQDAYVLPKLTISDTLKIDGTLRGDLLGSFPSATDNLAPVYCGQTLSGTGNITIISLRTASSNLKIEPNANLSFLYCFITARANDTITNYGKIYTDYIIKGENNVSTWINKANSFLSVGYYLLPTGKLICNETGNTIRYAPVYGNVPIKVPVDTIYYNLETDGADTTVLTSPYIYVNGDLTIHASTFNSQSNKIYIKGNWLDNGQYFGNNSTVIFNGSQDQTISAAAYETYENLILNNSPNKINLNADIVVNDTLTLNTIVNANGHAVTIGESTSNPGLLIFQSGKIIGKVKRWVVASTNSYLYPIGTNQFNTFVNITFPSLASGGLASFEFIDTMPGSNGLPLKDGLGDTAVNPFNDGYWIADTAQGFKLGTNTYSITLQGKVFQAFTINDSTKIIVRPHQDSLWRFNGQQGTNDPSNYLVSRVALDTFPWQFALADTTHCTPPELTTINGPTDVCRGDVNKMYTTDTSSINTFYWTVKGGYITQDKGDTVIISWNNNGQFATISVYARNSCTIGNTIKKTVRVHSIPPDVIYGPRSVPEGADSVLYYIEKLDNYTYSGSVHGNAHIDSITPGMDSAWISFPVAGTDTILTIAQYNEGCTSDTTAFAVYVYNVINSVQSGEWYDPSTWDCNCNPLSSDNVRIMPGDTVTIDQYTYKGITYYAYKINNVVVKKGGILTRDNAVLKINGDIINDGIIDYKGLNLYLEGNNKTIDGIGSFSIDTIELAGSRIISTNANLIFNGNIKLNNNLLTNQGKAVVNGSIVASNGTLINDKNATLYISDKLLPSEGNLVADSINNTIIYSGKTQNVIPVSPSSNGYYNLIIGGDGVKTADGDLTILGNFSIRDTGIFDITNHTIELHKNWYEYSSASNPFIKGTGLVLFNGSGDQYIYAPNGETFYDLKIGQNSVLNILPNQHFTVSNNLYIDGLIKMIMNNYNDTLPSFIYQHNIIYGTNGAVETDLYVNAKQWHEISPAILGLNSGTFTRVISGSFNPNFYWYDETMDLDNDPSSPPADPYDDTYLRYAWKYAHNQAQGDDIPLAINCGYLYYIDRNTLFQMKGKIADVTSTFDTTLSHTPNDPISSNEQEEYYDGWNLVGNPYTAYLSIDSLMKNAVNVDNGVYIWDDANGQYAGYQNGYSVLSGTLSNLIPPLQGFFVRSNSSGAILKIRPEYRTHGRQQYLKSYNKFKENSIKLGFKVNNNTEYFAAYFYPTAETEYNQKYDLIHLTSTNPVKPQIYSIKNDFRLALYSLPDTLMNKTIIPLYLKTSVSGTHTLKVSYINGLNNRFILLHDLLNDRLINLRNTKEITFSYSTDEDPHRFDMMIFQDTPPYITDTISLTKAYEDSSFVFSLDGYFADKDMFDSVSLSIPNLPNWLSFDGHILKGTPSQQDVGCDTLTIIAYDIFKQKAQQHLIINIINTNDPPVVNYKPAPITITAYDTLLYKIPDNIFTDPDPNDSLTLSLNNLPQWLEFNPHSQTLYGCPTNANAGTYNIILTAKDLDGEKANTTLTIKVLKNLFDKEVNIYPIPAEKFINVVIAEPSENETIKLYGTDGKLYKQIQTNNTFTQIDISDLQPGQYIIQITNKDKKYKIKFTKF